MRKTAGNEFPKFLQNFLSDKLFHFKLSIHSELNKKIPGLVVINHNLPGIGEKFLAFYGKISIENEI